MELQSGLMREYLTNVISRRVLTFEEKNLGWVSGYSAVNGTKMLKGK